MQPQSLPAGGVEIAFNFGGTESVTHAEFALCMQQLRNWARLVTVAINSEQAVSGVTGARPSASQLALLANAGVGYSFFDETLGLPVWWKGATWVDATGTPA